MESTKELWNYPLEEIMKGYSETDTGYQCVLCGGTYEKGHIYSIEHELYDACGAVKCHLSQSHEAMADHLLAQTPETVGISAIQRQLLMLMSEGKSDKEIAQTMGIVPSTVRNHRFKLREKEKQAKLFLALMTSLEEKTHSKIGACDEGVLREIHPSAAMVDDRYSITEQEYAKTVKNYMDETGALKQFPSKEKKKIILLTEIAKNFKQDVSYTEKEVNRILKRIYEEDYPSIRRALIEYGFMERSADGRVYRVRA